MRASHVATVMSRRTWLVSVSIVGHLAIGVGLFASGIWKLERLESDHRIAAIGVMTQSQAGGGGPGDLPEPKLEKKRREKDQEVEKKIVKDVQWDPKTKKPEVEEKKSTAPGGGGEGDEVGPGKDIGPPGDDTTTGTCALPPCGTEPPRRPAAPAPAPKVQVIPPSVMGPLRIAGDTQIHPSRTVKNAILGDGKNRVVGTVKVCIGRDGAITSVSTLSSTKYPEYDAQLLASVRSWRYRPYMVDGVPQPACSPVSFVYTIK